MLTLTRTSWRAFPRGLTQMVIGSPVVRGNRFAISKSSSVSGSRTFMRSAAADLRDQIDLAVGAQRGEVGVLKDLAVNRHRHALLDLAAETREPAVELEHHPAESVCLHLQLGQPAGEPAGCLAREMDARHRSESPNGVIASAAKQSRRRDCRGA